MQRTFIPFSEVKHQKTLVVDAMHPNAICLSHWRGANSLPQYEDDTSAGIVLNALQAGDPLENISLVSANHFDIDGFIGVWALLHPQLALQNEALLRQIAYIGDFREYDPLKEDADIALKLIAWINKIENRLFYPPFGAEDLEEKEAELCVKKFRFFLNHFAMQLLNPDNNPEDWEQEYWQVQNDLREVYSDKTHITTLPDLGMVLLEVPRRLHYYALYSLTEGLDIVLAAYPGNRYELEYKYTTWVDIASRPTLPRLNLEPLVQKLNQVEKLGVWQAEGITDTGPILRITKETLSRVERYGHPSQREIHPSSIPYRQMATLVVNFFKEGYAAVSPQDKWTWQQIKSFSASA
jgi:hypothetical protein